MGGTNGPRKEGVPDGPHRGTADHAADGKTVEVTAPAKLTVALQVTGVREDGYHLLESEMVTLDLADTLLIDPDGESGLDVVAGWPGGAPGWRDLDVGSTEDNLVSRALAAVGRTAQVRLVKRIPPGAGLGGGSADAAAVLRWAGCTDLAIAARIGADVPFCLGGGRARVSNIGDEVAFLPFEARSYLLLLPPFGVDTAAVYRAWDRQAATGRLPGGEATSNGLEAAAVEVEPRLREWKRALEEATGRPAHLAGSGSTWFVEGTAEEFGVESGAGLSLDGQHAPLVATRTTPAVE
jgi:4-diphosphocytidyl-2-C-methyl-D-erythritol kinase